MVIGGGQVVIPYMYEDLVTTNQFLTTDQFLTGFGLVQGMPGPMFSFSAYAGGLASSTDPWTQIFGALLSGLGIFLPGVLLIFFVYPIWVDLREIKGIKGGLKGHNGDCCWVDFILRDCIIYEAWDILGEWVNPIYNRFNAT